MINNFYNMLKPQKPTLPDEICKCRIVTPIKLMSVLSYNPIQCMVCNLEVPPEKLKLDIKTIDMIVLWRDIYDSLYRLWLDSDEYELFAKQELTNINSRVNKLGFQARDKINNTIECYYWYFHENELSLIDTCPICNAKLFNFVGKIEQKICPNKHIVVG